MKFPGGRACTDSCITCSVSKHSNAFVCVVAEKEKVAWQNTEVKSFICRLNYFRVKLHYATSVFKSAVVLSGWPPALTKLASGSVLSVPQPCWNHTQY